MDSYLIQSLIAQGKLVSPSEVDSNSAYIPLGVYQPGNRKLSSSNDAYPLYAIPLSTIMSGGATWGGISGTLSSQTDLQAALNSKYDASNPAGYISGITSGDVTTALGFTPYSNTNPANYIDATALTPYLTSAAAAANYQPLLGFTPEDVANKSIDGTLSANSDTLYPSQKSVKTYVDASVSGVLDDRGNWDASVNVFPSTGGSGPGGTILKGDLWFVSVPGTLGGTPVVVGNNFRALVDNPGQTATNWNILNVGLGFIPENSANKGIANGYASLDATGKVPASQIKYKTLVTFTSQYNAFTLGGPLQFYALSPFNVGPFNTATEIPSPPVYLAPKTGIITGVKVSWFFNNAGGANYNTGQSTLKVKNSTTGVSYVAATTLQFGIGATSQYKRFWQDGLNIPVTENDQLACSFNFPTSPLGVYSLSIQQIKVDFIIE